MGSTQFGNFHDFCRDSTLPICNILLNKNVVNQPPGTPYVNQPTGTGCVLTGINLSGGRHLANLGSIIVDGIAILTTFLLLWRSNRKAAAVGRREIQLFLLGFLIISICEIFSVGGFPLHDTVRRAFSAIHIAAITSTLWVLLLNALVGYQLLDDGTPMSLGLIMGSALAIFNGTGYIALDTAFHWTNHWHDSYSGNHRNIALYVLYQLAPLVFMFIFYILEALLVIKVLGEFRPLAYLSAAALLFGIGQVFQYVVSVHICTGSKGKIDGCFFESLFTLLSVIMVWVFWDSITEDEWPVMT